MKINFCLVLVAILLIFYITKQTGPVFNPRCVALYWTGGFDSSFRLLQLILIEKKCVSPIYLNFDGLDGTYIRRKNVNFEIKTMKKIINEIHKIGYGHLIMPLTVVTKITLSPEVLNATHKLHKKGFLRRAISQYAHMMQYSLDKNMIIEEGAENSEHSTSNKMVKPYLRKDGLLDLSKVKGTPLYAIRNMKFPIINLTKKDMFNIAKKHKFDYILQWTKSCWYPSNKGSPCGNCMMCKDRIIPENFRS
jgi:7-cyano-7-deazaguanine synthase in queuosine biosynthesis